MQGRAGGRATIGVVAMSALALGFNPTGRDGTLGVYDRK
jgi:hypothetical protein